MERTQQNQNAHAPSKASAHEQSNGREHTKRIPPPPAQFRDSATQSFTDKSGESSQEQCKPKTYTGSGGVYPIKTGVHASASSSLSHTAPPPFQLKTGTENHEETKTHFPGPANGRYTPEGSNPTGETQHPGKNAADAPDAPFQLIQRKTTSVPIQREGDIERLAGTGVEEEQARGPGD